MLFFLEKYSPGGTDLFATAVSLLQHQTGMGSCKNIAFDSGTRSEVCYTTQDTTVPICYSAYHQYNVLLTFRKRKPALTHPLPKQNHSTLPNTTQNIQISQKVMPPIFFYFRPFQKLQMVKILHNLTTTLLQALLFFNSLHLQQHSSSTLHKSPV